MNAALLTKEVVKICDLDYEFITCNCTLFHNMKCGDLYWSVFEKWTGTEEDKN